MAWKFEHKIKEKNKIKSNGDQISCAINFPRFKTGTDKEKKSMPFSFISEDQDPPGLLLMPYTFFLIPGETKSWTRIVGFSN